jgi:hypothetical protein
MENVRIARGRSGIFGDPPVGPGEQRRIHRVRRDEDVCPAVPFPNRFDGRFRVVKPASRGGAVFVVLGDMDLANVAIP